MCCKLGFLGSCAAGFSGGSSRWHQDPCFPYLGVPTAPTSRLWCGRCPEGGQDGQTGGGGCERMSSPIQGPTPSICPAHQVMWLPLQQLPEVAVRQTKVRSPKGTSLNCFSRERVPAEGFHKVSTSQPGSSSNPHLKKCNLKWVTWSVDSFLFIYLFFPSCWTNTFCWKKIDK